MGKTRDLFKKMGSIKDGNFMGLTEPEDIKMVAIIYRGTVEK